MIERLVSERDWPAREPFNGTLLLSAVLCLMAGPASAQEAPANARGKELYDKWCVECHGETGAGDGAAATRMLPRPRDFTRAVFQVRTTASGELATDEDLRRVIDEGMPGTAMPGWRSRLNAADRDAVIAYLKTFSTFWEGATPQSVALGRAPGSGPEGIAEGRSVFEKLECFKCHGELGRGDGQSAPTLVDDWDQPIRAADLSESWNFNGGSTVQQIYARLRTGLDGTPMPSFSDVIDAQVITDEQLWRVAQYVRSLSPEHPPRPSDVMRAAAVAGLPAAPDDSAWSEAERYYVPLVGQIVAKPRWFAPAVNAVWVQALHDGQTLALRLTWHDRSRSPDAGWDEWLGRMRDAVGDGDAPLPAEQGADRLHVQFPARWSDDVELPYFLGGSTRQPVMLWRWSSDGDKLEEGTATGLGRFTPAASGNVAHSARYDRGEWTLQITRPLVPADSAAIPFVPGRAMPIAFFAADGSSGEDDVRGAVSAWYAVYLDVPAPPRVYIAPVVAVLLTAGLGLAVVRRAQKAGQRAT
jgi:DMSO reductase family type II enzyme heme b subunit